MGSGLELVLVLGLGLELVLLLGLGLVLLIGLGLVLLLGLGLETLGGFPLVPTSRNLDSCYHRSSPSNEGRFGLGHSPV